MAKKCIQTNLAPQAVGPYSQAIKQGELVFISGQLGLDPDTGSLVTGGVTEEAEQAIKNLDAIVRAAGGTLENVVKTTVLLADIDDFKAVNTVYAKFFADAPPARAAYQVAALPLGGQVEIEAVAII